LWILFHTTPTASQCIVIGEEEKKQIIHEMHCGSVGGGNFGQNITIHKVAECYWWRGMNNYSHYENCQYSKHFFRTAPITFEQLKFLAKFTPTLAIMLMYLC
jgi:Integrase zinc binding domain